MIRAGTVIGRLTLSEDLGIRSMTSAKSGRTWRQRLWRAMCECGSEVEVFHSNVVRTKSCGCLHRETRRQNGLARATHGHSRGGRLSHEYMTWQGMVARCTRAETDGFERYGGRGISVCERWREFANFLADMGTRPGQRHTLDRIDNDGNYEPSNCRWATLEEQANNRSNSHHIEIDGVTKTLTQWAREAGVSDACIYNRLRRGLIGRALLAPSRRGNGS